MKTSVTLYRHLEEIRRLQGLLDDASREKQIQLDIISILARRHADDLARGAEATAQNRRLHAEVQRLQALANEAGSAQEAPPAPVPPLSSRLHYYDPATGEDLRHSAPLRGG